MKYSQILAYNQIKQLHIQKIILIHRINYFHLKTHTALLLYINIALFNYNNKALLLSNKTISVKIPHLKEYLQI